MFYCDQGCLCLDLLCRTDVGKHMQEKIGSDEGRGHVALGEAHLHLLRVESVHLTTHSRRHCSRCGNGVGARLFLSCVHPCYGIGTQNCDPSPTRDQIIISWRYNSPPSPPPPPLTTTTTTTTTTTARCRSRSPLSSFLVSASRHPFYPFPSSLHRQSYQRRSGVAAQAVAGLRMKEQRDEKQPAQHQINRLNLLVSQP